MGVWPAAESQATKGLVDSSEVAYLLNCLSGLPPLFIHLTLKIRHVWLDLMTDFIMLV